MRRKGSRGRTEKHLTSVGGSPSRLTQANTWKNSARVAHWKLLFKFHDGPEIVYLSEQDSLIFSARVIRDSFGSVVEMIRVGPARQDNSAF
jgi:hypothetical protein